MINLKKVLLIVACFVMLATSYCIATTNTEVEAATTTTNVSTYDELVKAVAKGGTIKLTKHIYVEKAVTIEKEVTLTRADGTNYNVCTKNNIANIFIVEKGGTLTLKNGVGVKGGYDTTACVTSAVIKVCYKGNLVVENGNIMYSKGRLVVVHAGTATFKNGSFYNALGLVGNNGGALKVCEKGKIIMSGGVIKNNSYGGIFVAGGSVLEMKGGTITSNERGAGSPTGNNLYGYGSGIYNAGTLTMTGGTIKQNQSTNYGGAIYNSGTFAMTGGTITQNSAKIGGAIYSESSLKITGGNLNLNTATEKGGCIYTNALLSMTGGTVKSNSCSSTNMGAGVYVGTNGKIEISGNAIILGENESSASNDIYLEKSGTLFIESAINNPLIITPHEYTNGFFLARSKKLKGSDLINKISIAKKSGWYTKASGNSVVATQKFTFTFQDVNGDTKKETINELFFEDIQKAPVWTKTGYNFKGWSNTPGSTMVIYQPNSNITVTENLTLYAIWEEKTININYHFVDGSDGPENSSYQYSKGFIVPEKEPVKFGYYFDGWYLNEEYNGTKYDKNSGTVMLLESDLDVNLYAKWEPKAIRIEFDANGGYNAPEGINTTYTDKISLPEDKPIREGFLFAGWNTKSDGTGTTFKPGSYLSPSSLEKEENIILHAIWKEEKIALTYNANGGTGTPEKQSLQYLIALTNGFKISYTIPEKTGYTFLGWYTNKECTSGAVYKPGASLTITDVDDITLYAGWRRIQIDDNTIIVDDTGKKVTTTLKISKSKITLGKGQKTVLKATSNGKVSYKTSNKKVAVVAKNGKITAKGVGTATITVSINGISKKCKIVVKKAPNKVTVKYKKRTLKKGKNFKIKYSLPSGSCGTVTFSSNRKSVATVTNGGVVKAKKKGTAFITVKTHNGKKAKIKITVK